MKLSKREIKKLKFHESDASKEPAKETKIDAGKFTFSGEKSHKKHMLLALTGIVIIAIAAYSLVTYSRPGYYDDFAKCLAENGAVLYGAMNTCKYSQHQKGMFGNSFKYLNYHEYQDLPGIKITPTWVINGKWYENVQAFDRLAELTGCKLGGSASVL